MKIFVIMQRNPSRIPELFIICHKRNCITNPTAAQTTKAITSPIERLYFFFFLGAGSSAYIASNRSLT